MDRSQALYDPATDLYTAVYFMPKTLSDRIVQGAGPCRGRPRVHAMQKRVIAAILAVWPVHHRQRGHEHGRHRNDPSERHQKKKYD
jgi:hypothetical protein